MVTLYKSGSGYVTSACDACGLFHELAGVGMDGSQDPPSPVFWCTYSAGGGGAPVLVAAQFNTGPVDVLPAPVKAAIQSGAIVR